MPNSNTEADKISVFYWVHQIAFIQLEDIICRFFATFTNPFMCVLTQFYRLFGYVDTI